MRGLFHSYSNQKGAILVNMAFIQFTRGLNLVKSHSRELNREKNRRYWIHE